MKLAAVAGVASAAVALCGCGQSSEEKATRAARQLVADFVKGDHDKVCASLTKAGQASLEAVAQGKAQSAQVVGCAANSQFVRDGTPASLRKAFGVDAEPEDVQVRGDRATVKWRCCTFRLQDVEGEYKVSDASALGRYFDVAGAGAGAGGESAKDIVPSIRFNLRGTRAGRAVTDIKVQATRIVLVLNTVKGRTRICRTVAGDSLFTGLPYGVSELLLESPDGTRQDCRKLLEAVEG